MLEPYEGKLSCTVLRGEGGSNALDLPDDTNIFPYFFYSLLFVPVLKIQHKSILKKKL